MIVTNFIDCERFTDLFLLSALGYHGRRFVLLMNIQSFGYVLATICPINYDFFSIIFGNHLVASLICTVLS